MSSISDPNLPQGEPASKPEKSAALGTVFMGPNGLRAGWRLSIYVVLVAAIGFIVVTAVRFIGKHFGSGQPPAPGVLAPIDLITSELIVAFIVIIAAVIMSRIEKRPFGAYGIPMNRALGLRFWQGMLWGLVMVSVLVGAIASTGAYSFGPLALGHTGIIRNGLLWLLGFFLVGVFEEFTFRGYTQYTLASGIGFWFAAVVLSLAFGALHLANPGEGPVGALSVFAIAMFFCLTLRRTGDLWFPIGVHCSFDWGETFLYSVPNSGTTTAGALSHSTLHGAKWITGGSIGPEGSLFCFLIIAAAILLFHRLYPAPPSVISKA